MLTGLPPFYDENTNDMYRKILTEPLHFPRDDIVPTAARDLLSQLLDRNADKRLGAKGAAEIKGHYFFHSIDWRKLLERKYEPSFKPNVVRSAVFSLRNMVLILNRSMQGILPTLIANLLRKLPLTLMSMVRCCRRRCSNSLLAGRTIALSQDLVMLEVQSRIRRSRMWQRDRGASARLRKCRRGCKVRMEGSWRSGAFVKRFELMLTRG